MSPSEQPSIPATIHVVGQQSDAVDFVVSLVSSFGHGIQRHRNVDSLTGTISSESTGCILALFDDDRVQNTLMLRRLVGQVRALPIVGILEEPNTAVTVELMQHGAFSVFAMPLIEDDLCQPLRDALMQSEARSTGIEECRSAFHRIRQATAKEKEVLRLIMKGRKNKDIAEALGITVRAVEDRRFRLMKKVGADSVAELVAMAVATRYYECGFSALNFKHPSENKSE